MIEHVAEDFSSPDKSSLGSVGQVPSVGSEVLPANILGVVPQSAHLERTNCKGENEKQSKGCVNLYLTSQTVSQGTDAHLSWGVSGVPQGVPQMLARASGGVDNFDGQARVALSSCGCVRPVGLCDLFPHDRVEA